MGTTSLTKIYNAIMQALLLQVYDPFQRFMSNMVLKIAIVAIIWIVVMGRVDKK